MEMYEEFESVCLGIFAFLKEKYDCESVTVERDKFGIYISYRNATTAVRISFEPRERGIFVLLSRLVDGKIPPYPIFVSSNTVIDSFYLDDVIMLRNPTTKIQQKSPERHTKPWFVKQLSIYANSLTEVADDILKGNFEIFEDLERIVKERAGKVR